jgi:menaquinol-cytochrome c reductase iron-sulfur subunit
LSQLPDVSSETSRRSYIGWLFGLCGAAVSAVLSVPLVRFTLFPLTAKPTETKWSDAGPVAELQSSTKPQIRTVMVEQVDGWRKTVSEKIVYISKDPAGKLSILSAVCPHLGCSVQWQDGKNAFVCPCHSAVFDASGGRAAGPAPRGMDTLDSKVEDGRLLVRYQYFRQLVPTKEVIG